MLLLSVAPATRSDWSSVLHADPFALPEQSLEWVDAICTTTGARDVTRTYTFDDGRTFVLPLVRTGPFAAGSIWSMPPAWGVGGIVGPAPDVSVVRAVVEDLRSLRSPRVSIRIDARHDELWRQATNDDDVRIPRRSHIVDLRPGADALLASLSKTTRYNIRRAERYGVTVEVDRTGALLDTHYELFLLSVRRWAGKQHEPAALALFRARRRDPIEKLRAMQRALGERCLTIVASVDGQPASSAIVLLGATARYTRGAMDADLAGPAKANFALQWRAITEAIDFGSTRYHMGESGESDGISQFKEKFGAVPVEHHEYRFERLPVTRTTDLARRAVKRVIGFRG